ncbi:MAG: hypothetical protein KGZ87_05480 [Bacteroidetes bacterium]|nr:hypothetical protein [Bacteroidota bacterium]
MEVVQTYQEKYNELLNQYHLYYDFLGDEELNFKDQCKLIKEMQRTLVRLEKIKNMNVADFLQPTTDYIIQKESELNFKPCQK